MNFKYRKSLSRLIPDSSGRFREYSRKWLILAGLVGVITGGSVIVLDEVIRVLLLGDIFGNERYVGLTTYLYNLSPALSFVLPFAGIVLAGVLLMKFASAPLLSGTDEVLEHYHTKNHGIQLREGLVKFLASILTIGLGGAAGLEGPSINAGGVIGSWVSRRFDISFHLTEEDLRILLLAGASAGIGAIFKAPLTGIVFALEVPYKDDIARKAFLPSIISGVASYVTFSSVEGATPLFSFASLNTGFSFLDIALSAVLGLIIGILAIGFSTLYNMVRYFFDEGGLSFMARFLLGGAVVGLIALVVRVAATSPYTYGAGYYLIQGALSGNFSVQFLIAILILRMLSTAFTLGSGGVGGIFFPLVVFGSLAGSLFGLLLGRNVAVFASVGIAAFMSAGYKTPLAAVTFVGDTTGSVSFLIPAMVASAVAYITSGESSVSRFQILQESGQKERQPV